MKDKHIQTDPRTGEARLVASGVSVWALIAYLQSAVDGDVERAADYEISIEDVETALDYYHQHRAVIDARILLNAAPSTSVMVSS